MKLTRKEFLAGMAGATVAGLLAPSCGPDGNNNGNGDAGTGGDGGVQNCAVPTITGNHGHNLTVPRADVEAGVEKSYEMGGAPHSHTVTLTAADFATLAADESVTVTSTQSLGHDHSVTVTCA